MSSSVLYVSYDGLMEPLGQSQIWQYLQKLVAFRSVTLVSYEKPEDLDDTVRIMAQREELRKVGLRWIPLRYHKRPSGLSTAYDIGVGLLTCAYLVIRYKIKIVHARSYVPSVIALGMKKIFNLRFVFDMRGFWADEKVEGGVWERGCKAYRLAKWFERRFLTEADVVISLTHAGVREMKKFSYLQNRLPRFEIITTCTNLEVFRPLDKDGLAPAGKKIFNLGCVGSLTWSMFELVVDCFKALLEFRPEAKLIILNKDAHQYIRRTIKDKGILEDQIQIRNVDFRDMPEEMNKMDAGIFFYKPSFSKKGTAPTKLGEFLGCGLPCISNDGAGDVAEVVEKERVGIILREQSPSGIKMAVEDLLRLVEAEGIKEKCVDVAHKYFSLEQGVETYHEIYCSLE